MYANHHFSFYLGYISSAAAIIPVIIGLIRKKYFEKSIWGLFYFVVIALLIEIICSMLRNYHISNLFVLRIYTVIEFILLGVFYSRVLSLSKTNLFITVFSLIFLGVALIDLYRNGLGVTDDLPLTVSSIFLMIYSLLTFFYIIQNPVYVNILAAPVFWFNTAVLVYFSGCLFLFIFNGYVLKQSAKNHNELWSINSLLNIIFNILLATGFWKTKHRQIL